MPDGEFASFGVYSSGQKLPEYMMNRKVYTEVSLVRPGFYTIEEDGQKYPVLPFTIDVARLCKHVVWMKVFVDGQIVISRPLNSPTARIDGVRVGTEIRELLFSLPKIQEDQGKKNPLGEYAGTIRLVLTEARCIGKRSMPVYQTGSVVGGNSQGSKLQHLSKKDVSLKRGDAVGNIVSREGRPTMNVTPTGQSRTLMKFVDTHTPVEELVLHYREVISSKVPTSAEAPLTKLEAAEEAEGAEQQMPLAEMVPNPGKKDRDGNQTAKSVEEQLTQNLHSMVHQSGEERGACSGSADIVQTEDVPDCALESFTGDGNPATALVNPPKQFQGLDMASVVKVEVDEAQPTSDGFELSDEDDSDIWFHKEEKAEVEDEDCFVVNGDDDCFVVNIS